MTHRSMHRRTFLGLGAAAGLTVATARLGGLSAQEQPTSVATPADLAVQDVYTFLVCGLDTRTVEEDENTDVIMIARVDLTQNVIRVISLPRDLLVEVPNWGYYKINGAYNLASKANNHDWNAGIGLTEQTIEYNFGVAIDAALTVNFEGTPRIIDALGGITVNNPYDVRDDQYPTADYGVKSIFYPAGEITLNGEQALEFSRTRHQDGDDGRVMRQQLVVEALLRKAQDPANVTRLPELVDATRDAVMTTIPLPVQAHLITAVPNIAPESVVWGTITQFLWGDTTDSGMWVYQGDWSTLPGYVQGFLDGTV